MDLAALTVSMLGRKNSLVVTPLRLAFGLAVGLLVGGIVVEGWTELAAPPQTTPPPAVRARQDTGVPEPATMLLFGIGLVGLAGAARRRRGRRR